MTTSREIVVVSGLPRSGTSLMMQMLAHGGLPPLTDAIREADADNPKGYYEFERVKKIKHDKSWLPEARGKAVKMISQLLYELPESEAYRVIFMRRDLDEIIASQETMLIRRGVVPPDRQAIKAALETHLERLFAWLPSHPTIAVVEIDYNMLVIAPADATRQVVEFVPYLLHCDAMLAAVNPTLYRNRNGRAHSRATPESLHGF